MPPPSVLPALAAIAVLGVTAGVQLGRASVAEIPARYFSSPEGTRSFAALSPNRSPEVAEPVWATASVDDGFGLRGGCVGCRTYPEEYHPTRDPAADGYDDGYAASAPAPVEVPEFEYAVEERELEAAAEPDMDAIQRYAHYPVTMEEAEEAGAVSGQPMAARW